MSLLLRRIAILFNTSLNIAYDRRF